MGRSCDANGKRARGEHAKAVDGGDGFRQIDGYGAGGGMNTSWLPRIAVYVCVAMGTLSTAASW